MNRRAAGLSAGGGGDPKPEIRRPKEAKTQRRKGMNRIDYEDEDEEEDENENEDD
jgi:hypothetical protein